jgi:hypothetical protein
MFNSTAAAGDMMLTTVVNNIAFLYELEYSATM